MRLLLAFVLALVAPLASAQTPPIYSDMDRLHPVTAAVKAAMGSTQSIMRREDGALFGASDPRQPTGLTAGY